MFNLVNVLPDEDKKLITRYIEKYGTNSHFVGVDEWLKYWGKEKIKLYKLFGNSFTYKVYFEYEKPESEYINQISDLINKSYREEKCFIHDFKKFVIEKVVHNNELIPDMPENTSDFSKCSYYDLNDIQRAIENFAYGVVDFHSIRTNKIEKGLKIKLLGSKKELQIQPGTKTFKAINKFLTYIEYYYKDSDEYKNLLKEFEEFRIAHSMILNDKIVKGDLCLSIHPLDFITMSDNDSNWQSCMNWHDNGCYHLGTVEMMNSNNVICCYLTNKKDWDFDIDEKTGEIYTWNNKRWRQLAYVTPEILMTGKSYPYANKEISFVILNTLKDLSKKNLNQDYEYGIELYEDMKYINGSSSMYRARDYRMLPKTAYHKRNIIFDTKGMYNDMLNDHCTSYWCYRNKVKKTTIISVSGKAPCLCCGEKILEPTSDFEWDPATSIYNERFHNCGDVVCDKCISNYFSCDICNKHSSTLLKDKLYYFINNEGNKVKICENCIKEYFKKCPICGKMMNLTNLANPNGCLNKVDIYDHDMDPILIPFGKVDNPEEVSDDGYMFPALWSIIGHCGSSITYGDRYYYLPIFAHPECIEHKYDIKLKDFSFKRFRGWRHDPSATYYTKILPVKEDIDHISWIGEGLDKYADLFYESLKSIDLDKEILFEKI